MNHFGTSLTAWRLAKGLTQNELALYAVLSRPNLSAIEGGRRQLTLKTIKALAMALGLRTGQLIDDVPANHRKHVSRQRIDNWARALATGRRDFSTKKNAELDRLSLLIKNKLRCHQPQAAKPVKRRTTHNPYYKIILQKLYGYEFVDRILRRVDKYI